MRRIPFLLGLFGQYWKNHPDLRFFQIISRIHQNIPAKIVDEFYLKDDEIMSILQKLCQSKDRKTLSGIYTLYSDPEALVYHSGLKTDGNTEYVDVYVDDAEYFDENTERDESVSFTFRLPQRKIVKIHKQAVVEAVHRGNVTGECLRCHHLLTVDDINAVKDGWQYRWRYDPHK